MRIMWILLTFGSIVLTSCTTSGKNTNTPSADDLKTITGRYQYTGNPCTTEPCLPGMVYSVHDGSQTYYLTVENQWFSENKSWGDFTPEIDDLLTIRGYIQEKKDIRGETYYTIEVVSLEPEK